MRYFLDLVLLCTFSFAVSASAADKGVDVRATDSTSASAAPRRLALIVGNGAYRTAGSLANPASDAELMASTLRGVGFQLHGGGAQTDLTRAALDQAIESFGDSLRPGDVALFYFSGHGLQVAGENYLVPIDADIKREAEVRVKTVPINLLFAKLEGQPNTVNIVILDACRNNPFARSFRSSGGGLVAVNAPTGTIVAFSTGPGQVAEDGAGKNSTYTAALAQYVREPGVRVEEVFKKVRTSVSGSTSGGQTPWENTSLIGNFSFVEGDALSHRKAELAAAGEAKKGELDALLRMEAEAALQREREQSVLRGKEEDLAKLDAQIAEMKSRLGGGTSTGDDSLQAMMVMVRQKEDQARKYEDLRKQREKEERKRQLEIDRLKSEARGKRLAVVNVDIANYESIAISAYGKDLADTSWQLLLQKYPEAAELRVGEVAALREVVADGISVSEAREREDMRILVGEYIPILGGCYQMGDIFGNDKIAKPVHEVCVDNFAIGKYEITQEQWRQVMGNNPSRFSGCDTCPVEDVSWEDVQNYLKILNAKTGKKFRLPTEAEWEYAARSGGKSEKFSGGGNLDEVGWVAKNSGKRTHPVGQKRPNGLGIYDMTGNVWEWCSDWKQHDYNFENPKNNPQGPSRGIGHSYRGGDYSSEEIFDASTTSRFDMGSLYIYSARGFRLVNEEDTEAAGLNN